MVSMMFNSDSKLLRIKSVVQLTGNSRPTIYLRQTQGLWPKPVRLGPRMVAWPASEVQAINEARIIGKSDDQIRALVKELEKKRATQPDHVIRQVQHAA